MFIVRKYFACMLLVILLLSGAWSIQHIPTYIYPLIRDLAVSLACLGVFIYNAFYITECIMATHGENHKGWKFLGGASVLVIANVLSYGCASLFVSVYWLKVGFMMMVMLLSLGFVDIPIRRFHKRMKSTN